MREKLYVVANEKSRLRKSKVKYSKNKVKFYDLFQANWVFEPNVHLCSSEAVDGSRKAVEGSDEL